MTQKEEIYKILREKQISTQSIAKALGVSNPLIINVISGKTRSKRVEEAITKLTGYEFTPTFKSVAEVKQMLEGVL